MGPSWAQIQIGLSLCPGDPDELSRPKQGPPQRAQEKNTSLRGHCCDDKVATESNTKNDEETWLRNRHDPEFQGPK